MLIFSTNSREAAVLPLSGVDHPRDERVESLDLAVRVAGEHLEVDDVQTKSGPALAWLVPNSVPDD